MRPFDGMFSSPTRSQHLSSAAADRKQPSDGVWRRRSKGRTWRKKRSRRRSSSKENEQEVGKKGGGEDMGGGGFHLRSDRS